MRFVEVGANMKGTRNRNSAFGQHALAKVLVVGRWVVTSLIVGVDQLDIATIDSINGFSLGEKDS